MTSPALTYQDVYLVPRYSELTSRSQADLSIEFLGRKFAACWLPANMESVINEDIAHWLSENNYPYIMHRFGDTERFVERATRENWKLISISVGVKNEDKILIDWLGRGVEYSGLYNREKLRVDFVTIDIAHAHASSVKEMIEYIREHLPRVKIIAGNVATPEAVRDLSNWGADACKIGVGGGAACSTKNMTGFHVPMFTCARECAAITRVPLGGTFCPLIFDGGVRENGDIAKALVAGGGGNNLVMAGSLFAACIDAPGDNVYSEEQIDEANAYCRSSEQYREYVKRFIPALKRYHGSASEKQKNEKKHVEGTVVEIPCNGITYQEKYQELRESLSSSVSYAGGKDMSAFRGVEWVSLK